MRTNILQVRKTLLALFAMLMPLLVGAQDFEVDGIYYNITSETDHMVEVTSSDGTEYSGSIIIPATVTHNGVEYSVTSIGYNAFAYCRSLTTITIPEDSKLTSIGERAFYGCNSLTSIILPEGVTSIGESAFDGCSSLTAVHISSLEVWCNIDFADSYANPLCYAKNLYLNGGLVTELTIPNSVTAIKNYAFEDCSSLTAITIPEGVTSIGDEAFEGCRSLYKVINYSDLDIQKGSTDNGYVALYAEVVYQGGELTTIGDFQFYTSDRIHSLVNYIGKDTGIVLPDSYNGESYNIGGSAFSGCSSLTSIKIPEGVTSIGESAFNGCSSLTAINIPENSQLTSIGDEAFCNCSSLTTINIPENSQLTSIGDEAFYNCSSLTAINIPKGVTSIGRSTFEGCSSLKELTLGKGLKKIAAEAFNSCTALEKVTIYATRPPSIDGTGNAFFSDATYENATLYVPQGCIDKYQVMTGWSGFYTIEEMEGGTPNYLTLRQADNGEVGIVVEPGRTYKVRITAFEGWKIHSVTFNGEEVTDQLTEEGTFTTPALSEDAVLNIAYEKIEDDAMIENTSASRIKVQGHHGTLRITGTTEGDDISVYTTDGMLVAQESTEGSDTEITLPTGQVYIVTVADKVVKIGL